jgi:hypothetical protein
VTAINDGQPPWSRTDNLLADLWALLVKVHSDPDKTPEVIDHPARAEQTAKQTARAKAELKAIYLKRQADRRSKRISTGG